MNVDLPNLTSIISEGSSFEKPRSVTLESISEYWILIVFRYSKSSKCQATKCIPECSIEINLKYCLLDLISFIDVSTQLRNICPLLSNELQSLDAAITSIYIPDYSINDMNFIMFDFSRFTLLESIEIGDNCFGSVQIFQIEGLNRLKTIKIGNDSFTQKKYDDESKSFHILNCGLLESIQIGEYSFTGFGGEFELKNLPQLQSIQIGTIGSDSWNFCHSSFVIRGIELILNIVMIRSSKSTIHYIR